MTKGYDGVKRWTKQVSSKMVGSFSGICSIDCCWVSGFNPVFPAQVDLFSKSLLLVPIHLEVHWCLVTADVAKKKICLYDSQGHALQKVARVIADFMYFFLTIHIDIAVAFPEVIICSYLQDIVKLCFSSLCFAYNRTSWNTWWQKQRRRSKRLLKMAGPCRSMRYVLLML